MSYKKPIVYPYIPNSIPATKAEMLREINAKSVDELFADIPENIRIKGKLKLPEPFLSEAELVRHVEGLLNKNTSGARAAELSRRGLLAALCPSGVR